MDYFVLWALIATLGTWFVTALGAATVVFFRSPNQKAMNLMLGFASGVMIAASFWSLLQPAIERAEAVSQVPAWFVATAGFLFGAFFMWLSDKAVTFARRRASNTSELSSERVNRIIMLVLSITLHNIPEGMAVGLGFVLAGQHSGETGYLAAAMGLALGIGIQNFPEGAAISLPVRQSGASVFKSFITGCLSGIVEPIAGVLVFLTASMAVPFMPWLLAFAAGAMIYVVADELIPQAQPDERSNVGTIGVMAGFLIMMVLDVALG